MSRRTHTRRALGPIGLLLPLLTLALVPLACSNAFAQVLPGVDVLAESGFGPLVGRRVGLVLNQTAVSRDGRRTTLDIFLATDRCRLTALFAPEHGIDGTTPAGVDVNNQVEPRSKLPIYSLYGATKKPTKEMLSKVDILVYDIQDIGVRSYTYISTLIKVMEGCAEAGVPLVVLDRPNPIGGDVVDGPVLDTAWRSFIGIVPVPYIHGMTVGELATMANNEGWLEGGKRCQLTVIRLKGWRRWMTWRETGLPWIPTSPNVPSPESALANGITGGIGELQILNIGIGSPLAFQVIGREWIDRHRLAAGLNALRLPGIQFRPTAFPPRSDEGLAPTIQGVHLVRVGETVLPFTTQIAILTTLRDLFPERRVFDAVPAARWQMFDKVCGNDHVRRELLAGATWQSIAEGWSDELARFISRREGYLLYE